MSDQNNALHFLLEEDPVPFRVDKCAVNKEEAVKFVSEEFQAMKSRFREKIQYMSPSYYEDYRKREEKIYPLLLEVAVEQSGALVIPNDGGGTFTYFYDVGTSLEGEKCLVHARILFFENGRGASEPFLSFYLSITDDQEGSYTVQEAMADQNPSNKALLHIMSLLLLTKHGEFDIFKLKEGKKVVWGSEQYVNETALPVGILDSSWFACIRRMVMVDLP